MGTFAANGKLKPHNWLRLLCVMAPLVILTDFILPGNSFSEAIIELKRERQQYYNAAGNYHYSYRVFTKSRDFSVSASFAKEAETNAEISYSLSPIFKEVNGYYTQEAQNKNVYSLRLISGLIFPLVFMVVMLLGFKYESKIEILTFVFQVLLVADLVYLII